MISFMTLALRLVGAAVCFQVALGESDAELVDICNNGNTTVDLSRMCLPSNDSNAMICSGRGVCVCGQCICNRLPDSLQYIYGRYCECDNFSCPRANGKICGGHGTCGCDQMCQCQDGWTGRDCSCPASTASCMASNGKICNGQGSCVCGVCTCQSPYQGATCELCPTCPTPCVRFRDCVLYKAFYRRPMNESEFKIQCQQRFIIMEPRVFDNITLPEVCQFVDPVDECTFFFKYEVSDSGNVTIFVNNEKPCPGRLDPIFPVLSIYKYLLNQTGH